MTRRQLLLRTWLKTALVAAISVVALYLSGTWFLRVDLTRDGRYTLSETAIEAVGALDEPLTVDVYFSGGLRAPYHDHERAVIDLFDELAVASGGRLQVRRHDPSGEQGLIEEARYAGVRPIPYVYRELGQQEAREVYMGAVLRSGDQEVALPALTHLQTLERDVVEGILAVTTPAEDRPRIGWLVGHGEPDPARRPDGDPLNRALKQLGTRADVSLVQLDEGVPASLDALLVVAPMEALTPEELAHLDQYVMGGGALGVFLSTVRPDFEAGHLKTVHHGLERLLEPWGIRVGTAPLLDREHNEVMAVPFGGRVVRASLPYALVTDEFGRQALPVRFLDRAVAPFATAVRLSTEGEVWLTTEPTAVESPTQQQLDLRALSVPLDAETRGAFPLVVARSGRLSSAVPVPPELTSVYEEARTESPPTRLVVVGSGDFAVNNTAFLLNTVDWLVGDPRLIDVRTRGLGIPRLEAPDSVWAWKLGMVGLPLFALALAGVLVGWRRR